MCMSKYCRWIRNKQIRLFLILWQSYFLYRLPFTMLVLQKAANMVCSLREVAIVACAFMFIMLLWMALWSFGAAGVVASSMGDGGRWWLLVVSWQVLLFIFFSLTLFSQLSQWLPLNLWYFYCCHTCIQVFCVSLFWTGAVLCNTVHVIVSGLVFLVLIHGGRDASSMPPNSLMKSLRYAVTTSFGSICYGSLFTAAIRTLRWEVHMRASFSS